MNNKNINKKNSAKNKNIVDTNTKKKVINNYDKWSNKNNKDHPKSNKNKVSKGKPFVTLIFITIIIMLLLTFFKSEDVFTDRIIWLNQLENNFEKWLYKDILIDENKAFAIYTWTGELSNKGRKVEIIDWINKISRDIIILPNNDSIKDLWLKNSDISTIIAVKDNSSAKFWSGMIPTVLTILLFWILAFFILWKMWWMANNAMTFSKSRAKLFDKNKNNILFKDVAWAEEEKQELSEIVDFLKNPKKYKDLWAKIPKGTLLVWPPGTGKTMLARAVAWESGVPFLSISGSEFVEMFVWVWASRVRDLFENAKKIAPAIIFIDEIDAIWKKRWPGNGGWHDEREQTLNQILTEMDWFDNETNVIVMWATNRADVLDKALLRPGRFDRKITVNLPNLSDREQILQVHARNKKIEKNIDYKALAGQTVWFSWADMWNLLNESAIITARKNEKIITNKNIIEAFERIVMWLRKKSQVMNKKEREVTAYHEVGHALVWKLLPNTDPVHKVSIVSRGWALWVTWFLPERDSLLTSKSKYLDELATLYGWRAAEEIFFGKDNITTGASNDIERATKIARQMVTRFWMFSDIWAENFIWEIDSYSWQSQKPFLSEETIKLIDNKVKEILENAYKTAIKLINENKVLHEKISKDLLEKEEINKEEFSKYFT